MVYAALCLNVRCRMRVVGKLYLSFILVVVIVTTETRTLVCLSFKLYTNVLFHLSSARLSQFCCSSVSHQARFLHTFSSPNFLPPSHPQFLSRTALFT